MGRNIKSAKLDTRNARAKLKADKNPYWERLGRNEFFGYRKGKRGGSWVARVRLDDGKFKFHKVGVADDNRDADGAEVLDFFQAQTEAKKWLDQVWKLQKGVGLAHYTVNDALDDYLDYLEAHKKSSERAAYSIKSFIRPAFGTMKVTELTSPQITKWHKDIANEKPRVRSKSNRIAFKDVDENEPDYKRKRKSSANRILTILKAALNRAYYDSKIASDDSWRRVKPFSNVDSAKIMHLNEEQCKRLVNFCDQDFRPVMQAAMFTGCRYGEIIKMRVQDYNPDIGSIYIPETKTGKPRHVTLDQNGQAFFEYASMGKIGSALIFTKTSTDGSQTQWKKSDQTRRVSNACKRAYIEPAISFNILRHTHASQLLKNGAPMSVIAKQLGNSVKICEKHYAHLAPSYVSETIRANFPELDIFDESNVVSF